MKATRFVRACNIRSCKSGKHIVVPVAGNKNILFLIFIL